MQVVCYFGKAARQGKVTLPTSSLLLACEDFARKNALTGLLAVADGYFLHVLEGEDAAVQNLVGRIAAFWDQESPTVLFEQAIDERAYQQWNVAIAHGAAQHPEAAQRLAQTRSFLEADDGDAADPFRYFLTPSRTRAAPHEQRVRQVAIFSNSVLWFNPIFSHLSDRLGTQTCALKISNTGREADSYPLDYADVMGETSGPVRVVGISEDLLASTLSQPLLEKIELMVFLMRRSGQGTDTAFVARALAHPVVQRCKPRVLLVTPGGNVALSEELHTMVTAAGLTYTETRGSVLMGGPTWKAIQEQLRELAPAARKPRDTIPAPLVAVGVDLELEPVTSPSPSPSPSPTTTPAQRTSDLSNAALKDMLQRLSQRLNSTTWAAWMDTQTGDFAAKTDNAPADAVVSTIAAAVTGDLQHLARLGAPSREMITTFSLHYEIIVPHPLDAALVLYVFARLDDMPLAALRRLILDDLVE